MKKYCKVLAALTLAACCLWAGRTSDMRVDDLLQKYSSKTSRFVSNKQGLNVHYRDEGLRNAKTIVLLHGNSNSLHTFEPLVRSLTSEYRIVSLDFPGHGLTGMHPSNKYGYEQLEEALELVVKHLALDNYTLLGHSMGGWVAWRYAAAHPHELHSLILMSASGMPARINDRELSTGIGFKLLASPLGPTLSSYMIPRSVVQKSTEQSMFNKKFVSDKLVNMYWELLRHPENRRALAYRASSDREEHKAHLAKRINIPTLLIWGEKDSFVPSSASLSFSERITNTQTMLLPNVGHMPMIEATQSIANRLRKFLASE